MSFSTNNPYPTQSYSGKSARGSRKFGMQGKLTMGKLQKEITMLKRAIPKPEKKTYDDGNDSGPLVVASAGTIYQLDGPTQGDGEDNRIGDSVNLTSSHMRYSVTTDAGTFADNELVRVIVFIDHQGNGVVPTVAELLVQASVFSPVNSDNLQRFKIVYDQLLAVNGLAESLLVDEYYRKLKVKQTYPNGADIATTNGLYLCVIGKTGGVAHIQYYHRMRYTDA